MLDRTSHWLWRSVCADSDTRVSYLRTRSNDRAGIDERMIELPIMKGEPRDGESRIQFGDFTAQVRIVDGKLTVVWLGDDGRPVDLSTPADMPKKRVAPRSITGEVRKLVSGNRESIEALYLRRRPLTYDDWRARFLDDTLNGEMTQRLIWRFGGSHTSDD